MRGGFAEHGRCGGRTLTTRASTKRLLKNREASCCENLKHTLKQGIAKLIVFFAHQLPDVGGFLEINFDLR